jgi:hypothetical protein
MMGILGTRRILTLLILVVLNAALAGGVYMVLIPQQEASQKSLRNLHNEVTTRRADIARMQVEFDQLEEQKAEFQKLEADGFFKNQSRKQAENTFNTIQKKSGVTVAVASINAGVVEDNEEAAKAKYKVLKSPMQIKLEAVDDVDIYHYIFLVEHYFPGHVSIESLNLKREADVSGTVLRAIASGDNPPLVKAELQLVWRTMIPEAEVIGAEAPTDQQGGVQ